MADELDKILTLDEMPGWIRVSRQNIVKRVREGRDLPPYFRCGRKILFRLSKVQEWIEQQENRATTEELAAAVSQEPRGE
jgi:predicted DNA-binding transcriptional regulator AlpA